MPHAALARLRPTRPASIVLAIALLAGIAAGSVIAVRATADTAETEVRITARRLADGRTEFALQQRAPSGDWGARITPDRRFFPNDAAVNRWLNSSPIPIGLPVAQTAQSDRHEQVDPTSVDAPPHTDASAPQPPAGFTPLTEAPQPPDSRWPVRVFDRGTGLSTIVQARPSGGQYASASRADYIAVGFSCLPGIGLDFIIANLNGFDGSSPTARVAWSLDSQPPTVEQWDAFNQFGTPHLSPTNDRSVWTALQNAQTLYITIWASTAVHQLSFDLDGMFDTPAQGNLNYCGNY